MVFFNLIILSINILASDGFQFPDCSITCSQFFPNLSSSFAHGYDPTKRDKIEKPNIVTNERKKRHLHEGKRNPNEVDLSDHHVHAHEDVLCYGHACILLEDDYDRFITPYEETVYGKDTELPVHFAMTVFAIETGHGNIWLDFMIEMTWEDNRLKVCLCDDSDNIRDTVFPRDILDHIFVPDVVFLDAMQHDRPSQESGSVGVWMTEFTSGTRVLFKRRMSMTLSCFLNFRFYPEDVNACPVLLTAGLDHVFRVNMVMSSLPHMKHIARGEEFLYTVEELPEFIGNGKQTFVPYTKYGVSDEQNYAGFLVVMRRKASHSHIYDHFLSYFVSILVCLLLVPLRHQRFSPMGLFGIAIGAVIMHLFENEIVDYKMRTAIRYFPAIYFSVLIVTGITIQLQVHFKSRYVSIIFDGICAVGLLIYWNLVTGFAFKLGDICPDQYRSKEGNFCIHNAQNRPV